MTQSLASNANAMNQISENALTFKKRKKLPLHRLPFVDKEAGKDRLSFWSVPKTGGYHGGNITGRALALLYLKHIRSNRVDGGGLLQNMALDMFDNQCEPDNPAISSLRGQAVGFFLELENIIKAATAQIGGCLDFMDEEELLRQANIGINLTEDETIKELESALNGLN